MDLFNRNKVKILESKITELEGQLRRANAFQPMVYVSKGDALPLVVAVHMSDHDMEIPMSLIQRRICEKLASELLDRDLVRFEVTDDPRTMCHIIHARIDVVNRG